MIIDYWSYSCIVALYCDSCIRNRCTEIKLGTNLRIEEQMGLLKDKYDFIIYQGSTTKIEPVFMTWGAGLYVKTLFSTIWLYIKTIMNQINLNIVEN